LNKGKGPQLTVVGGHIVEGEFKGRKERGGEIRKGSFEREKNFTSQRTRKKDPEL